jgi:predicted phosphodiesterase
MFGVKTLYRRVFWPDTHCGEHDKKAVSVAMQITKDVKPHQFIFLGDFQNCASVSEHSKSPEVEWQGLKDELKPGISLMYEIIKAAGNPHVVYISGNHEKRIASYVNKYATKLHGLLDPVNILGIPEGWTWVPYGGPNSFYKCGNSDLIAMHGSLLGATPSRSNANRYKISSIAGHSHRLQTFYSTGALGETIVSVSAGHLSDVKKNSDWMSSPPDWQAGMVVGYFKKSGKFFLEVIEIKDGEAIYNGKLVTA